METQTYLHVLMCSFFFGVTVENVFAFVKLFYFSLRTDRMHQPDITKAEYTA